MPEGDGEESGPSASPSPASSSAPARLAKAKTFAAGRTAERDPPQNLNRISLTRHSLRGLSTSPEPVVAGRGSTDYHHPLLSTSVKKTSSG